MNAYLLVFAGGGLGALSRYLVAGFVDRASGMRFPYGTMTVNIVGSFAMGLLITWLARRSMGDQHLRLLLATGFLGGFTTLSSFSLDAVTLFERGAYGGAAFYVLGSVIVSILALFAALIVGRYFLGA